MLCVSLSPVNGPQGVPTAIIGGCTFSHPWALSLCSRHLESSLKVMMGHNGLPNVQEKKRMGIKGCGVRTKMLERIWKGEEQLCCTPEQLRGHHSWRFIVLIECTFGHKLALSWAYVWKSVSLSWIIDLYLAWINHSGPSLFIHQLSPGDGGVVLFVWSELAHSIWQRSSGHNAKSQQNFAPLVFHTNFPRD